MSGLNKSHISAIIIAGAILLLILYWCQCKTVCSNPSLYKYDPKVRGGSDIFPVEISIDVMYSPELADDPKYKNFENPDTGVSVVEIVSVDVSDEDYSKTFTAELVFNDSFEELPDEIGVSSRLSVIKQGDSLAIASESRPATNSETLVNDKNTVVFGDKSLIESGNPITFIMTPNYVVINDVEIEHDSTGQWESGIITFTADINTDIKLSYISLNSNSGFEPDRKYMEQGKTKFRTPGATEMSGEIPRFIFKQWVPSVLPYENDVDFPIFTDASGYVYNIQTYETGIGNSDTNLFGFSINTNNPNATIDNSNMNENYADLWYLELSILFNSATSEVIVQPIINQGADFYIPTYITIGNVDISDIPTGFNYFRDYANNWPDWADYEDPNFKFKYLLQDYGSWYNPT